MIRENSMHFAVNECDETLKTIRSRNKLNWTGTPIFKNDNHSYI